MTIFFKKNIHSQCTDEQSQGAKKGWDYKLCTCILLVDYGSDFFVLRVAYCLPIDIKETIPNWDKSHFIKLG